MIEPGYILRGRYHIIRTIGRGGMADVYLAFDERRQAHVAIKVLREDLAEDPEFVRRFRREALTLAQLDHPNIVRFYSFEQEGILAFIVLDYVPGKTLRRYMAEKKGAISLGETTWILRSVGAALHYAHNEGIVHRDVKPGNIMLREDGQVLVSDFGIAQIVTVATVMSITIGTPAYMSPEQIRGEKAGPASDIYSLGVVLFEMITGRRPFTGEEGKIIKGGMLAQIREAHLHLPPPNPRTFNPELSQEAADIILKALAKKPEERWPDIMSMVRTWEETMRKEGVEPVPPLLRTGKAKVAEEYEISGTIKHPGTIKELKNEPPRWRKLKTIAIGVIVTLLTLAIIASFLPRKGHHETTIDANPTPTRELARNIQTLTQKRPTPTEAFRQKPAHTPTSSKVHTGKTWKPTPTATPTPTAIPTKTPTPTYTMTATWTPTITPTPYAQVAVKVANFRTGPGTIYDIIGHYPWGTPMRLQGRYENWYYMTTPDGKHGWMAESVLKIYGNVNSLPYLPPPPTPTPTPTWTSTWTPLPPPPTPTPPPPTPTPLPSIPTPPPPTPTPLPPTPTPPPPTPVLISPLPTSTPPPATPQPTPTWTPKP